MLMEKEVITIYLVIVKRLKFLLKLLENFRVEDLEIVDFDGKVSLLTSQGYPNKKQYSDHLPIKFTLAL